MHECSDLDVLLTFKANVQTKFILRFCRFEILYVSLLREHHSRLILYLVQPLLFPATHKIQRSWYFGFELFADILRIVCIYLKGKNELCDCWRLVIGYIIVSILVSSREKRVHRDEEYCHRFQYRVNKFIEFSHSIIRIYDTLFIEKEKKISCRKSVKST